MDLPNPGIELGSPALQADSLNPEGWNVLEQLWITLSPNYPLKVLDWSWCFMSLLYISMAKRSEVFQRLYYLFFWVNKEKVAWNKRDPGKNFSFQHFPFNIFPHLIPWVHTTILSFLLKTTPLKQIGMIFFFFKVHACVYAQSCPTLCYSMDCKTSRFLWFSRQDYWSGLPFPSPGNLLTQRSHPHLLHWQEGSLPLSHLKVVSDSRWPQGL